MRRTKTFTVGFDVGGPEKRYLDRLAAEGDGGFFQANAADELNTAIREVINEIAGGSQSFTQFSIDVNKATFSHDNRVYLSLFSPNSGPAWGGNLKGYFIDNNGVIDTLGQPALELVDGTLQFAETTQSFWSSAPDVNEVMQGGVSQFVTGQASRNLYTFVGGAIPPSGVSPVASMDPLSPSLKWQIDASTTGFSNLLKAGQKPHW